jgi:hypothetical protein
MTNVSSLTIENRSQLNDIMDDPGAVPVTGGMNG